MTGLPPPGRFILQKKKLLFWHQQKFHIWQQIFAVWNFPWILIALFSETSLISRSEQNTIIRDILMCWGLIFLCTWVSNVAGISGKSKKPRSRLKYISIFFCKPLFYESIKNITKTSSWFEKYCHLYHQLVYNLIYKSQDLKGFVLWIWTYKAVCKIFLF